LVYGFFMGSWWVIGVLWPCVQALDPTRVAQLVESFRAGDFGMNVLKKPSLLSVDRHIHTFAYIHTYMHTCVHQHLTSISPVSHQYLTGEILVRYWRDTARNGSISPVSHQYLNSISLVRYW